MESGGIVDFRALLLDNEVFVETGKELCDGKTVEVLYDTVVVDDTQTSFLGGRG